MGDSYAVKLQSICFLEKAADEEGDDNINYNDGILKFYQLPDFRFDKCFLTESRRTSLNTVQVNSSFNTRNVIHSIEPAVRVATLGFNTALWTMTSLPTASNTLNDHKEFILLQSLFESLYKNIELATNENEMGERLISYGLSMTCFEVFDVKLKDLITSITDHINSASNNSTKSKEKTNINPISNNNNYNSNNKKNNNQDKLKVRKHPEFGTFVHGLATLDGPKGFDEWMEVVAAIIRTRAYLVTGPDPNSDASNITMTSPPMSASTQSLLSLNPSSNPNPTTPLTSASKSKLSLPTITTNNLGNNNNNSNINNNSNRPNTPSMRRLSGMGKITESTSTLNSTGGQSLQQYLPVPGAPTVIGATGHVIINIELQQKLVDLSTNMIIERKSNLQVVLLASTSTLTYQTPRGCISNIMTKQEFDSRSPFYFTSDGSSLLKPNNSVNGSGFGSGVVTTPCGYQVSNLNNALKSLSTLTRVVQALQTRATNQMSDLNATNNTSNSTNNSANYVPFRDHLLTRLLQPSLTRDYCMFMLLAVDAVDKNTPNLLRFGSNIGCLYNNVSLKPNQKSSGYATATATSRAGESEARRKKSFEDAYAGISAAVEEDGNVVYTPAAATTLINHVKYEMDNVTDTLNRIEATRLRAMRALGLEVQVRSKAEMMLATVPTDFRDGEERLSIDDYDRQDDEVGDENTNSNNDGLNVSAGRLSAQSKRPSSAQLGRRKSGGNGSSVTTTDVRRSSQSNDLSVQIKKMALNASSLTEINADPASENSTRTNATSEDPAADSGRREKPTATGKSVGTSKPASSSPMSAQQSVVASNVQRRDVKTASSVMGQRNSLSSSQQPSSSSPMSISKGSDGDRQAVRRSSQGEGNPTDAASIRRKSQQPTTEQGNVSGSSVSNPPAVRRLSGVTTAVGGGGGGGLERTPEKQGEAVRPRLSASTNTVSNPNLNTGSRRVSGSEPGELEVKTMLESQSTTRLSIKSRDRAQTTGTKIGILVSSSPIAGKQPLSPDSDTPVRRNISVENIRKSSYNGSFTNNSNNVTDPSNMDIATILGQVRNSFVARADGVLSPVEGETAGGNLPVKRPSNRERKQSLRQAKGDHLYSDSNNPARQTSLQFQSLAATAAAIASSGQDTAGNSSSGNNTGVVRRGSFTRSLDGQDESPNNDQQYIEDDDNNGNEDDLPSLAKQFLRAVACGRTDEVEQCISDGVDVQVKNHFGRDAMQIATRNGQVNMLSLLLDHGGNIATKGPNGETLFLLAAQYGHLAMLKWLDEHNCKGKQYNYKMAKDYDVTDNDGQSAVHIAARKGELAILRYLHSQGLDFNLPDNSNRTPLASVPKRGHSPDDLQQCRDFIKGITDEEEYQRTKFRTLQYEYHASKQTAIGADPV